MVWLANPPDNTDLSIDILPADFDLRAGFCVKCGWAIDIDYRCSGCNADHWPAIKRTRQKAKDASHG